MENRHTSPYELIEGYASKQFSLAAEVKENVENLLYTSNLPTIARTTVADEDMLSCSGGRDESQEEAEMFINKVLDMPEEPGGSPAASYLLDDPYYSATNVEMMHLLTPMQPPQLMPLQQQQHLYASIPIQPVHPVPIYLSGSPTFATPLGSPTFPTPLGSPTQRIQEKRSEERAKRGPYNCTKCGEKKKGHNCSVPVPINPVLVVQEDPFGKTNKVSRTRARSLSSSLNSKK